MTSLAAASNPPLRRGDVDRLWQFMRIWMPLTVRLLAPNCGYGVERLPAQGGAVVAVNHFAAIDPPLVGIYSRRPLYYMTKAELLGVPFVGEILRWAGAFPVRRGAGDRDALRLARRLVRDGNVVGVFVEGTRQRDGRPGAAQAGAAMLAIREQVPIVPCGIDTFGWSLQPAGPALSSGATRSNRESSSVGIAATATRR